MTFKLNIKIGNSIKTGYQQIFEASSREDAIEYYCYWLIESSYYIKDSEDFEIDCILLENE
jgi:hypothetical protein